MFLDNDRGGLEYGMGTPGNKPSKNLLDLKKGESHANECNTAKQSLLEVKSPIEVSKFGR